MNAANSSLLGGGGIDGAIHIAAGEQLLNYCKTLDGCQTGDAKISPGFNLAAKHIIHTVGPKYHVDSEPENLLRRCYTRCFEVADKEKLQSLAICCISCGIYGYPLEEAAKIAINTSIEYLTKNTDTSIRHLFFSTYTESESKVYTDLFDEKLNAIENETRKSIERTDEETILRNTEGTQVHKKEVVFFNNSRRE